MSFGALLNADGGRARRLTSLGVGGTAIRRVSAPERVGVAALASPSGGHADPWPDRAHQRQLGGTPKQLQMPMSCVDEMDIGGGRRLKVMCDAPGTVGPTIGVTRRFSRRSGVVCV